MFLSLFIKLQLITSDNNNIVTQLNHHDVTI